MAVRKKTKKSTAEPVEAMKTGEANLEDLKTEETQAEAAASFPAEPDAGAEGTAQEESEFVLKYDVNSNQRYVDSTSQKSEFDKVLDELASISKEMLDWNVEKFTRKHGEGEENALSRKWEAFLGGFITNAAMEL